MLQSWWILNRLKLVSQKHFYFSVLFFYVLFPIPGLQRYPALNYSPMHPVNHPNSLKTCFLVQEQTLSSWAHTIHFVSALLVKNKTKNKHSQVYLISPLTSHVFFFFFYLFLPCFSSGCAIHPDLSSAHFSTSCIFWPYCFNFYNNFTHNASAQSNFKPVAFIRLKY